MIVDRAKEIPNIFKTLRDKGLLSRLEVPMLNFTDFRLSRAATQDATAVLSLAEGKPAPAKRGSGKAAKAKAKSKAAKPPPDPSVHEHVLGADGQLRKTRMIDDIMNFTCHALDGISQQDVDLRFVMNMIMVCLVFGLTGDVKLPKDVTDVVEGKVILDPAGIAEATLDEGEAEDSRVRASRRTLHM